MVYERRKLVTRPQLFRSVLSCMILNAYDRQHLSTLLFFCDRHHFFAQVHGVKIPILTPVVRVSYGDLPQSICAFCCSKESGTEYGIVTSFADLRFLGVDSWHHLSSSMIFWMLRRLYEATFSSFRSLQTSFFCFFQGHCWVVHILCV